MRTRIYAVAMAALMVLLIVLSPVCTKKAYAKVNAGEIATELHTAVIEVSIDDGITGLGEDSGIVTIEEQEVALAGTLEVPKKSNTPWIMGIISALVFVFGYMAYRRAEARRYAFEDAE